MTYLDQYRSMDPEELSDWADSLFRRSLDEETSARLIELRNIVPFLIDRLRQTHRRDLTKEQKDLLNRSDQLFRRGKSGESLKLRNEAARLSTPRLE